MLFFLKKGEGRQRERWASLSPGTPHLTAWGADSSGHGHVDQESRCASEKVAALVHPTVVFLHQLTRPLHRRLGNVQYSNVDTTE